MQRHSQLLIGNQCAVCQRIRQLAHWNECSQQETAVWVMWCCRILVWRNTVYCDCCLMQYQDVGVCSSQEHMSVYWRGSFLGRNYQLIDLCRHQWGWCSPLEHHIRWRHQDALWSVSLEHSHVACLFNNITYNFFSCICVAVMLQYLHWKLRACC